MNLRKGGDLKKKRKTKGNIHKEEKLLERTNMSKLGRHPGTFTIVSQTIGGKKELAKTKKIRRGEEVGKGEAGKEESSKNQITERTEGVGDGDSGPEKKEDARARTGGMEKGKKSHESRGGGKVTKKRRNSAWEIDLASPVVQKLWITDPNAWGTHGRWEKQRYWKVIYRPE